MVTGRVERIPLVLEVLPSLATSVLSESRGGFKVAIRILDVLSAKASEGFPVASVGLGGGELKELVLDDVGRRAPRPFYRRGDGIAAKTPMER